MTLGFTVIIVLGLTGVYFLAAYQGQSTGLTLLFK